MQQYLTQEIIVFVLFFLFLSVAFYAVWSTEPGKSKRYAYRQAKKFCVAFSKKVIQIIETINPNEPADAALKRAKVFVFASAIGESKERLDTLIFQLRSDITVLKKQSDETHHRLLELERVGLPQVDTDAQDQLNLAQATLLETQQKIGKLKDALSLASDEERVEALRNFERDNKDSVLQSWGNHVSELNTHIVDSIKSNAALFGWLIIGSAFYFLDVSVLHSFFDDVLKGAPSYMIGEIEIRVSVLISMLLTLVFAFLAEQASHHYFEQTKKAALAFNMLAVASILAVLIITAVVTPSTSHIDIMMRILIIPLTTVLAVCISKIKQGGGGFEIIYAPIFLPFSIVVSTASYLIDACITSVWRKYRLLKAMSKSEKNSNSDEMDRMLEKEKSETERISELRSTESSTLVAKKLEYSKQINECQKFIEDCTRNIKKLNEKINLCELTLSYYRAGSDNAVLDFITRERRWE